MTKIWVIRLVCISMMVADSWDHVVTICDIPTQLQRRKSMWEAGSAAVAKKVTKIGCGHTRTHLTFVMASNRSSNSNYDNVEDYLYANTLNILHSWE